MYYLGVDSGGTFTDFVAFDADAGSLITAKVPSTPSDPAQALVAGLTKLSDEHGVDPLSIRRFIFGTTVATNAVLELKGARTLLLTTRGTRDVIEIQRLWRHRLFDLYIQKSPPLVPRRSRVEVEERAGSAGEIVTPLTEAEVDRLIERIERDDCEAIAVCLLFSFLNPAHERRLRDAIAERLPGRHVSISSDISPEFREYERATTTIMNAYVMPKVHSLIERLERRIADLDVPAKLRIIQSNGGLMNTAKACSHPVHTLLSGPAGGVVGAVGVAEMAGARDIIAMDMGGTSLDICLIKDARITLSTEGRIGPYPIQVPQVNVHTIGAGGGSIARVFHATLKVGPESAGAVPGPVCYDKGGDEPTSTDAAVALGYIDPDYFLGGEMRLDREAARDAIRGKIGEPLGMDLAEAATAIVRVQVANMVTGIRAVSVEKGWDARQFTLMPFGGAGALYAGLVARELNIGKMIVPVEPSVLSALGMLLTDIKYTDVRTRLLSQEEATGETLAAIFADLERGLGEALAEEGIEPADAAFHRSCDMRYRGQAYEINVPAEGEKDILVARLVERFHIEHRAAYAQAAEDEPVEFVNYRVTADGRIRKAALPPLNRAAERAAPAKHREAYFGSRGWLDVPVYARASLGRGAGIAGPALVEEPGATLVLYPGQTLAVDPIGNLLIDTPKATDPSP